MIQIITGKGNIGGLINVICPEESQITINKDDKSYTKIGTNVNFLGLSEGVWNITAIAGDKQYTTTEEIILNFEETVNYFEATINVTFPVDCTNVTCSKGDKSYSVPSGSLPSGSYTFAIPEAGEWTLECTNGVDTDTETVNVTEEKAYTALLGFALILFENGSYDPTTGGWTSITQNKLELDHTDGNPYMESYKDLTTNNAVDLSGYNTLNFHVESAYNRYHVQVGTSNSKANNTSSMTAYKDIPENKQVTDETISVDISKINSAYIKLCVGSYNNMNCNITVDKVWAVK